MRIWDAFFLVFSSTLVYQAYAIISVWKTLLVLTYPLLLEDLFFFRFRVFFFFPNLEFFLLLYYNSCISVSPFLYFSRMAGWFSCWLEIFHVFSLSFVLFTSVFNFEAYSLRWTFLRLTAPSWGESNGDIHAIRTVVKSSVWFIYTVYVLQILNSILWFVGWKKINCEKVPNIKRVLCNNFSRLCNH